ncbi:hypothetical protein HYH03_013792 [Edaphochlamys debaryana]|uniref:Bulb-type lectin domain-containing protein n=1 Tax=Edaphochlamys debaryana TaxID=47281 RepID=A0A835XVL1_9CHLO|nr:hypothetical protein HYH03_013792 [Edaphochlamys debaryana]|eukprot:KAG2487655.1 hypothetical protein HYH03_013792 [Edaphochlamys debaryana]
MAHLVVAVLAACLALSGYSALAEGPGQRKLLEDTACPDVAGYVSKGRFALGFKQGGTFQTGAKAQAYCDATPACTAWSSAGDWTSDREVTGVPSEAPVCLYLRDASAPAGPAPKRQRSPSRSPSPTPTAGPSPSPSPKPSPSPSPSPSPKGGRKKKSPSPKPLPQPITEPLPQPVTEPLPQPVTEPLAQALAQPLPERAGGPELSLAAGATCPAAAAACPATGTPACGLYSKPSGAGSSWACDGLSSPSRAFRLTLDAKTGELAVIRASNSRAVWRSGVAAAPSDAPFALLLSAEGGWRVNHTGGVEAGTVYEDVAQYGTGRFLPSNGGAAKAPFRLQLRDTGVLVLENGGGDTVWASAGPQLVPCTAYERFPFDGDWGVSSACRCACPEGATNVAHPPAARFLAAQCPRLTANDPTRCMALPSPLILMTLTSREAPGALALGAPAAARIAAGAPVTQEAFDPASVNLQFSLVPAARDLALTSTDHYYSVQRHLLRTASPSSDPAAPGLCLAAAGLRAGAAAAWAPCDPAEPRQAFAVTALSQQLAGNLCLSVPGASAAPGAPLALAECAPDASGAGWAVARDQSFMLGADSAEMARLNAL